MNDSKAVPAAGMHRAKTWEIGFYALNNTSTNTYMMMMMYVSYLVGGIMGVGFALVSVLLTVMRVWDGVTDPIIGFMVDKTNGRLGKNRPFIIIGNLILMVCSFIMFFVGPQLPENFVLRLLFFIVVYAIYIIGYTCQCVVTKSAQSCMTNDPKQRPTFAIFDSIYNAVIMTGLGMLVTMYLVPKYTVGEVSGFMNPAMFRELWFICVSMATVFAILALIGIWRKDRPEYFGLGVAQRIRIRDYWEVLKNNRAIQMLVVAASTDKLFMSVQSNTTLRRAVRQHRAAGADEFAGADPDCHHQFSGHQIHRFPDGAKESAAVRHLRRHRHVRADVLLDGLGRPQLVQLHKYQLFHHRVLPAVDLPEGLFGHLR